jgi:hypothetical protein
MFIYTTSPDPQHVLISINQQLNPLSIPLGSDFCKEIIGWDPVTSTTKDPYAIDFE